MSVKAVFIETEEASVMFKRVMAFLLMCLMLMTIAYPAFAAAPTPTPTPRPTPTPQPTIPVFGTSDVEPTPLPNNSKGQEMDLEEWYDWYYQEAHPIPNGNYKEPTYIREDRVVFDEYNLPEPMGAQYELKTVEDFDRKSPALYTCTLKPGTSAYNVRSIYVDRLFRVGGATKVDVLYVDPLWLIVRYKGQIGYVKRHRIQEISSPLDDKTPPYGVQKHQYVAVTKDTAEVRVSMSHEDYCWAILNPGTTISIWQFDGEWAVVNYWRTYGYIHISDLTDIRTVSPTDQALNDDTPIAAYTSYYKFNSTETIRNRIHNIALGVQRMSVVLRPGQTLDANATMGPYALDNGYLKAGALVDGGTTQSPSGGTCQVASTLYNVLLQLPGITVTHRRAHGDNSAPYLPMHVDAAVGNNELNLVFRNDYSFPIRFEGHTSGDGALCWLVYRVFED